MLDKKEKSNTQWWLVGAGALCLVIVFLILPNVINQKPDWQTVYYTVASLGVVFLLAALNEISINRLSKKLDR